MFPVRALACLFTTALTTSICWADSPYSMHVDFDSGSASLQGASVSAKADDIDIEAHKGGTRLVRLHGHVRLALGEVHATAESAELSLSGANAVAMRLSGDVKIKIEHAWATAERAMLDRPSTKLALEGAEGKPVRLQYRSGGLAGQLTAAHILFDSKTMSVKTEPETTFSSSGR